MTLHFSIVIEKWRLRQIQMACIFLIHGPCFLPCSPFEAKLNTVREDVIGSALCNASCTKQTAPTPHHHFCSDKKNKPKTHIKTLRWLRWCQGMKFPFSSQWQWTCLLSVGFPCPVQHIGLSGPDKVEKHSGVHFQAPKARWRNTLKYGPQERRHYDLEIEDLLPSPSGNIWVCVV